MEIYKEKVIMSYLCIKTHQEDLMDRIINVGMEGEYKEIGETFSPEDSYVFDILQFRNTEDITLNTLIALYDEMEKAKELIRNVNAISDEEIAAVFPDWLDLITPYYGEDDEDDEFEELNDLENFDNWEDWEDGDT